MVQFKHVQQHVAVHIRSAGAAARCSSHTFSSTLQFKHVQLQQQHVAVHILQQEQQYVAVHIRSAEAQHAQKQEHRVVQRQQDRTSKHSTTWHGTWVSAQRRAAQHGAVRYGTVRCGSVQYGTVLYGMVCHDMVQYGTVRLMRTQYNTGQRQPAHPRMGLQPACQVGRQAARRSQQACVYAPTHPQ